MPFFRKNQKTVLFVHIPKTGGTSIELTLRHHCRLFFYSPEKPILNSSPQHFPIKDINDIFGSSFYDYSFSIIRNPYKRIESEYFYQKSMTKNLPGFNEWLEKSIAIYLENPFYMDNHFRPQSYFLDDSVAIFRFEDGLEKPFLKVCSELGLTKPIELPRILYTDKTPIQWHTESIDAVNNIYSSDFEKFGYRVLHKDTSR